METGFSLALTFIIGGVLLVSILSFNANISQTAIMNSLDLSAQIKLRGIVDFLKSDLRKLGYKIDREVNSNECILGFNEDSIAFRTFIDTITTDTVKIELF